MRSKSITLLVIGVWLCSFIIGCFENPSTAGGDGVETGNAIVFGTIVDEAGDPVIGAVVKMIPEKYNPLNGEEVPDSMIQTTQSDGEYLFPSVALGVYNIQVSHLEKRTSLLIPQILVEKDTVQVPTGILRLPGTLLVPLPEGVQIGEGYLYILGTNFYVKIDSNNIVDGYIILDSIPVAVIPDIQYVSGIAMDSSVSVGQSISVASSDTTKLFAFGKWNLSKEIHLNTSASGANIMSNQIGFPLLLRLDRSNFDFAEAGPKGEDIRFSKLDSTVLPYAIENWDSDLQSAEIWVLLDTIYGNSEAQSFKMFWGLPGVLENSSGSKVFHSQNGFGGVWHLNNNFADETGFLGTGINQGTLSLHGKIAGAKNFDGSAYVNLGGEGSLDFGTDTDFTIAIWIRTFNYYSDTIPFNDPPVVSNKRWSVGGYGINEGYSIHLQTGTFRINVGDGVDRLDVDGTTPITDGNWHYCAAVADRDGLLQIYIDGQLDSTVSTFNSNPVLNSAMSSINNMRTNYPHMLGDDGVNAYQNKFEGDMDEVRISKVARSADWIRLSYENQKENQTVVVVQP